MKLDGIYVIVNLFQSWIILVASFHINYAQRYCLYISMFKCRKKIDRNVFTFSEETSFHARSNHLSNVSRSRNETGIPLTWAFERLSLVRLGILQS